MANKRKTTTAIVAGVTAAALLLGGTFAWTSISQQAKNEAIVDINPGGRLHDDFNGTNKDVYVENFGDTTTGVPIYARIRLDQYFEVGQDAGINKEGTDRKVNQILGTDINNVETWVTYQPGETLDAPVQANGNWQWTLGNDDTNMPYYMPTFNMNKDSLAADINGTYEGITQGDIVHYDDYKKYDATSTATGNEVYDWDDEDAEEEENPDITTVETTPRDSADVYHKENQTHTAQQIDYTATVYTMAEWIAAGSPVGPYWVYDTDGWAYWAQPIKPGETTGLLLDGINMSKVPDDNYYYGINVVGQFATKGDIYMFEDMSPEAEVLFGKVTESEEIVITGDDTVYAGGTATYTAVRNIFGETADAQPTFTWTATDADGADITGVTMVDGTLTVDETVAAGTTITVTATASDVAATLAEGEETTTTVAGSKTVTVLGSVELSAADNTERFTLGQSVDFTAVLKGLDSASGGITWNVTDADGNALTTTTAIAANADDSTKATLTVDSAETAYKLVVKATYKLNDSGEEFTDTYELVNATEILTTDDLSASAYAILTDDGSGNSTYAMTFIRSGETPTTDNTYQGSAVVDVFSDIENIDNYSNSPWNEYNYGYLGKITSVKTANTFKPISLEAFMGAKDNIKIDLSKLDMSEVTSMKIMFKYSHNIEVIFPENFTSKVTDVEEMFYAATCDSLTLGGTYDSLTNLNKMFYSTGIRNIDLSGMKFTHDQTISLDEMFMEAYAIETLKLPENITVGSMSNTFLECNTLKSISGTDTWDFSKATNMSLTFSGCSALTLNCSNWNVSSTTSHGNFNKNAPGVILPAAWQ